MNSLSRKLLLLACLVIAFVAYRPGLNGEFFFDDVPNIVNNSDLQIDSLDADQLQGAALSNYSGTLKRPISMLTFALNYYVSGYNPFYFKLVNVFIHLANGVSIYLLTYLILIGYRRISSTDISSSRIYLISFVASYIWLLSPINVTSVLYVVQRMTSLSVFFVLWGMVIYTWSRLRMLEGKRARAGICVAIACVFPAVFSKESGILLPAYIFILELTLFKFKALKKTDSQFLVILLSALVIIPAVLVAGFLFTHPEWILKDYQGRQFDWYQRILTESRILWFYIHMIILPSNAQLGIFHDDVIISKSLFDPMSTSWSILGLIALVAGAIYLRRRSPLTSLGLLLFFAAHSLESTFIALELVHEHRNYFASYGLILALLSVFVIPQWPQIKPKVSATIIGAFAVFITATTYMRANVWGDPRVHYYSEARNHPQSPRANTQLGELYARLAKNGSDRTELYYRRAKEYYLKATRLKSNHTSGLLGLVELNARLGKQTDDETMRELLTRMEYEPYMVGNVNWINYLAFTGSKKGPLIQSAYIQKMMRSSLRNTSVSGRTRIELLSLASKVSLYEGDHEAAVYLLAQAVSLRPKDPRYRLHLVSLLIAIHRYADARQELKAAEADDLFGAHKKEIKSYNEMLSKVRIGISGKYSIEDTIL